MMRSTIAGILLAIATLSGASAQPKDPVFLGWVATIRPMLAVKETGIREAIVYRDQVCPLQAGTDKRADCKSRLEIIIDRRRQERTILSGMIDAANLPNGEGRALDEIVNPIFRKMNDDTSAMADEVTRLYPRPSTVGQNQR